MTPRPPINLWEETEEIDCYLDEFDYWDEDEEEEDE